MSQTIYQAIASIRGACENVEKLGFNEHQQYAYATEADLSRAIRPLLAQHGLVILPSATQYEIDSQGVTHVMIGYTIAHVETGETVGPLFVLGSGSDPQREGKHGDKGAYKANTGSFKYLLTRLFMVDTGDDPETGRTAATAGEASQHAEQAAPPAATQRKAPPARKSAPRAGRLLSKADCTELGLYKANFKASEAVHGAGEKTKFAALNWALNELGFERVDKVPAEQGQQLLELVNEYASDSPRSDDSGAPF